MQIFPEHVTGGGRGETIALVSLTGDVDETSPFMDPPEMTQEEKEVGRGGIWGCSDFFPPFLLILVSRETGKVIFLESWVKDNCDFGLQLVMLLSLQFQIPSLHCGAIPKEESLCRSSFSSK